MNINRYFFFQLFLIILIFISGCAVTPQQATLDLGTPPDQPLLCGDAHQISLGIAPIIDQRPKVEHSGDKARALYLGVWNQRSGKYVSSDKDFKDQITDTMVKIFSDYITKSNCFRDVKVLQSRVSAQLDPQDLMIISANENVDYLLVIELNHFFGEQSQNTNLLIVPALYVNAASWNNEVGQAIGYTECLATLYDMKSNREVWKEKITGNSESTIEGAYPQVARESLIKASQELTQKLFHFSNEQLQIGEQG
jgi:hypothetical protein